MTNEVFFYRLAHNVELQEHILNVNKYLDHDGKEEFGKALSCMYKQAYEDCMNDLAEKHGVLLT